MGPRYWYQYYGEMLDQVGKTQLAEGFKVFLGELRLTQETKTDITPEVAAIKREVPRTPKKTGRSMHLTR
jgi:hypothetical protein